MKRSIAIITGATSGIGAAFAKSFAEQGYDLLITGRRETEIKNFAAKLQNKYNVNVEVVIAELSDMNHLEALINRISILDNIEVLVNNAGFGYKSNFFDCELLNWTNMLRVHTEALVRITYVVLKKMLVKNSGSIINVSSVLGFFPWRKYAMYTATKAFINMFTKTLALELKGKNIAVQTLCPGLTVTDFHQKLGQDPAQVYKPRGFFKPMLPDEVVAISLRYLKKKKVVCVPGFMNKMIVFLGFIYNSIF